MSPRRPGWYVVCDACPFKAAETAQRELGAIERLGACPHDHQIEEEK